ncbi:MAG: Uma2 family endonuclease [Saprospiraceae bacterium]|nr:Uma2 family endonuclease [Saprospiraceae bacterium]
MTEAIAFPEKKTASKVVLKPVQPKRISWEQFERIYLRREDKYKYEWVDGFIEKTERPMNQYQDFLADNLIQFFYKLKFQDKISGRLTKEVDTFFLSNVHRRPDMMWFSDEQSARMAYGENQVPNFVVEIISSTDRIYKVVKKLKNYEDAGVKVVWLIFPELEEIQVYHGSKSRVYRGDEVVSATPVLPDFTMKVSEVFAKPPKPAN